MALRRGGRRRSWPGWRSGGAAGGDRRRRARRRRRASGSKLAARSRLDAPVVERGDPVRPRGRRWPDRRRDRGAAADEVDEGRIVAVGGHGPGAGAVGAGALARAGAARILVAERPSVSTTAVRGGLRGALDEIRRRAESALERGTPEASAALLRGFVLGQDDRIPEDVRDDFRRSGLAHVLAVSGQNVMLLATPGDADPRASAAFRSAPGSSRWSRSSPSTCRSPEPARRSSGRA